MDAQEHRAQICAPAALGCKKPSPLAAVRLQLQIERLNVLKAE